MMHLSAKRINYFPRMSSKCVRRTGDSTWSSYGTVYIAHNSESNGLILNACRRTEGRRREQCSCKAIGRICTTCRYTVHRCANMQLHARIDVQRKRVQGNGTYLPFTHTDNVLRVKQVDSRDVCTNTYELMRGV